MITVKKKYCHNYRFIHNGEDLTFKLFSDGGYAIRDNITNEYVLFDDVSKEASIFFILKKLQWINENKNNKESA